MEVVANRGASGIDGFVSTALGMAAAPGPVPLALAGDISMLHDQNGFLIDRRPDCVFVVIDNDGGGIFSFLPQAGFPEHFERVFGTPHGRSFERYAALHDLAFARVDRPDRMIPLLSEAREAGGIHLIEVRTDRRSNVEVHRRVAEATHRALDGLFG
jgi:2-succinyl-5-enolpyruvyl-6-hydroxy-3-cyclohexene-1-carboxylate synthase